MTTVGRRQTEETARWPRRLLDAAQYAAALTVLAATASALPAFLLGAGLVGVKVGLFFVGFAYFGYATLLAYPTRDDEPDVERDPTKARDATPLERRLGRIPPLSRYPVRPDARLGRGVKLFAASLLTLAVSYAMETVFGIVP